MLATIPEIAALQNADSLYLLDLFSTSATTPKKCHKNAPYICIAPTDGRAGKLFQGCCNDWLCPRCGELRAKHEYGRMIEGARKLAAAGSLYMLAFTCENTEAVTDAEKHYGVRTHRLLDAYRLHVKRAKLPALAYAAVTERQKRGHPHSHLIASAAPTDAFHPVDDYDAYTASIRRINAQIPPAMRYSPTPCRELDMRDMHSEWLQLAAVKAGLGVQADICEVDVVEGAARYIAKYLFKAGMFTHWPKGWKRVRYSQNWPKLDHPANDNAFALVRYQDWQRAALLDGELRCAFEPTYEKALLMGCMNAVYSAG